MPKLERKRFTGLQLENTVNKKRSNDNGLQIIEFATERKVIILTRYFNHKFIRGPG